MRNKVFLLLVTFVFLLFANGRFSMSFASWIAAALLLYWVRQQTTGKGFLWAWLLLTLAWMFQFYGMVPLPAPFFITVALVYGLIGSLPYLIDSLLVKQPSKFIQTLIFPCSWALIDYLTQYTPYGSWGHAAYSQHSQLVLLQSVSVFGMSYITFLIGWFASISNWSINQNMQWSKIRKGIAAFSLLLLLTLSLGSLRLISLKPESETVRVASLSAIKKEEQRNSPELQMRLMSNQLTEEDKEFIATSTAAVNQGLLDRSIKEARAGAKIIFWGEANGTVLKQDEPALFEKTSQIAKQNQIYLGISLATLNLEAAKPLENKLVMFDPDGKIIIDYWKANPVPGGEAAMSATKGKVIQQADTPFGNMAGAICFDMDFPRHLAQASGVDIFLAPSNDWKAIDPWHTEMAKFRGIEQGFNLVRHTSNGLSAGSDYTGKFISEMDHYMDKDKVLITHLPTKGTTTVYSIIGDSFPLFCLFLLVLVGLKSSKYGTKAISS